MEHDATPAAERRKSSRTTLDKILYLNLEPHNGGIVLNVSDGGLAFHAIAPIQGGSPIRFWFSLAGGHELEATCEIAWTDKTKKVGGLRFTELAETTRVQIRDLLDDLKIPSKAETSPVYAPAQRRAPEPAPAPSLPAPRETVSAAVAEQPQPGPLPGFRKGDSHGPPYDLAYWVTPTPQDGSSISRSFGMGFLIVALIAVAAILIYVERQNLGAAFVVLGEKLEATAQRAPTQQAAAPTESAVAPGATSPTAPLAATAAPPAAPSVSEEQSTANTPATNAPQAKAGTAPTPPPAPPDGGQQDLAAAQRYLDGAGTSRSSATAAQFLWAAVEKDNIEAEFVLAGLYLRGDGVTKSCEQARVLLRAASSKGNAEARDDLANLYRDGCS